MQDWINQVDEMIKQKGPQAPLTLADLRLLFRKIRAQQRKYYRKPQDEKILTILHETGWSREETAGRLGISVRTLYRKIKDMKDRGLTIN